jgi:Zn-dependent protease
VDRRNSLRVGSLDGIPLWLHWSWPLGAIAMLAFHSYALFAALGTVLGFSLVVLVHELGHAALVRAFRERVLAVTFFLWGGECAHTAIELTKLQRSVIAWGGVLGQAALLAVTTHIVGDRTALSNAFVNALVWALLVPNTMTIVLNLVPLRPLDGYLAWQLPYHAYRAFRVRREADRMIKRATRGRASLRVVRGGKKD